MFKKLSLLIVALLIAGTAGFSQDEDLDRKYFGTFFLSPFSNYTKGKIGLSPEMDKGYVAPFTSVAFLFNYDARYNLVQPGDDGALALIFSPALGVGFTSNKDFDFFGTGMGQFHVPVFLSFEYGAGATFASLKDRGFGIGVGVEYNYAPFVIMGDEENVNEEVVARDGARSSLLPVMTVSYRKWSRGGGFLFVHKIKYGFLPYSVDVGTETIQDRVIAFSYSLGFSFT